MAVDLDVLLNIASDVALSAGRVVRAGADRGPEVSGTKSSATDIVTDTDHASEAHIVEALRKMRPDDAILGEEGADDTGTSEVRWVIDPIDGTVNFAYGIPGYSVSIGAEVDGVPAVGVVFNPVTGELFKARTGGGSTLNDEPIAVRPAPVLSKALVATGFGYEAEQRQRQAQVLLELLPRVRDIRRLGSAALDMCFVACGRLDAYYEEGIKPWDVCAGTVIATEAGARVSGFDGRPYKQDIIVSQPTLISELRRIIGP